MKQENKNFIYNVVYQIFLYVIPLVLTPYVSRVLGANNIGIYSYTYSIVSYFMLFTMLGINNYGSRNIAMLSKDKDAYSQKFWSIYGLQFLLGIVMVILYNLLYALIIKKYDMIFRIQNFFLISAIFDINWLYFGLEKFKVTIVRNTIIKVVSAVCIFAFVKTDDDLWIYTLILGGGTLLSQLYLFTILGKSVVWKRTTLKQIFSNVKECLVLFIPVLAYSVYRIMDKTMIGMFSSTLELGYYENAEKIINIPVGFITALGTVMLPHMAKIDRKDKVKIVNEINESFKLCMCFVIPIIVGLLFIAKDFSVVFFGSDFLKSGEIIMLLSISILFSGIANVVRTNYLIPFELDGIYVKSTIYGAFVNLFLNSVFIPKYGAIGAGIGTIAAEFTVMLYQVMKVKNVLDIAYFAKCILQYVLKAAVLIIPILLIKYYVSDLLWRILLQVLVSAAFYVGLNYRYILFDFLGLNKKKRL